MEQNMTAPQIPDLQEAERAYEAWVQKKVVLDMSRGKPGKEQLDMVSDILTVLRDPDQCLDGGVDVRNYGTLKGIPSARALFADILGCRADQIFVGGSASLQLMYDAISKAMTHGMKNSSSPWAKSDRKLKWLCPAPGYDRHFKITESFGFEMITIAMTPEGPDMEQVLEYIRDPDVKGIWLVPKYSNPTGIVFSDETIRSLAAMKPAAPDFMMMWDNAYCVHEIDGVFEPFEDILSLCGEAGNADMVYEFASTSKITLPGAGISCMASSAANIDYIANLANVQLISYDKVNQMRHVLYLKDRAHTLELMKKHAAILKPKFDMVCRILEEEIAPLHLAQWNSPKGGYFIAVRTLPRLASETLRLCKEAGVTMTSAGAVFPYGKDPDDAWVRIAPSLPSPQELETAMHIFAASLKLAAARMAKA